MFLINCRILNLSFLALIAKMEPWNQIMQEVAEGLWKAFTKLGIDIDVPTILNNITEPTDSRYGDLSSILCFKLFGKDAKDMASKVVSKIEKISYIYKIEAVGGFINFRINWKDYSRYVIRLAMDKNYGKLDIGRGKTVVVDFSSPNVARPFMVSHLRSTVIGQALINLYRYLGYKCVGINYLGDWGTSFGKLLAAYRRWGDERKVKNNPIEELFNLYVRFHRELDSDPSLEVEAREWLKKLEMGDEEAIRLWKWFRQESIHEFSRIYDILNVEFDLIEGESEFVEKGKEIVQYAISKGIASKDPDGSIVVKLEDYGLPNLIIMKSDGTTLYQTRDLAAALSRYERFKFHRMLYVVGREQNTYFKQLFQTLKLLGYDWSDKCRHVSFGLLTIQGLKMATRYGRIVRVKDILNAAFEKAESVVREKNPSLSDEEKKAVARAVSIGALKFSQLNANREENITFTIDKAIDFKGDTGPYIQYAYARSCKILKRSGYNFRIEDADFREFSEDPERSIVKLIAQFPTVLKGVSETYDVHLLARYILDLAKRFTIFYDTKPVLREKNIGIRNARLVLVNATSNVLKSGLSILGIEAPETI
ncbi:MAG: arginine--tRNA ligase [Thermoproteota archaeon]|nr:MAG: arginine--tRNA ligase [Candidatus Korarchaeota archaeon]